MKKLSCKVLTLLMAVAITFSLAACGDNKTPPASAGTPTPSASPSATPSNQPQQENQTDWTGYTDWLTTDWAAKTVSYQFTGSWSLEEYGMNFAFLLNLYSDGSVLVDQRNTGSAASYNYFGYWSEENTEDGNEITLDTLYMTGLEGDLVAHEYNYSLYEESDGNYSFGYTFGIAPGAYFRDADMAGSSTATYATLADFYATVDHVVESYRFVNTEDVNGFSAVISVLANNTLTADLCTEYEGKVVVAHQEVGTLNMTADENNNMSLSLTIGDTEIPLSAGEDGTIADFAWTANWANQNITVDFTMTQTDVVAE